MFMHNLDLPSSWLYFPPQSFLSFFERKRSLEFICSTSVAVLKLFFAIYSFLFFVTHSSFICFFSPFLKVLGEEEWVTAPAISLLQAKFKLSSRPPCPPACRSVCPLKRAVQDGKLNARVRERGTSSLPGQQLCYRSQWRRQRLSCMISVHAHEPLSSYFNFFFFLL